MPEGEVNTVLKLNHLDATEKYLVFLFFPTRNLFGPSEVISRLMSLNPIEQYFNIILVSPEYPTFTVCAFYDLIFQKGVVQ